jgi:methionyl-tRNA synthetase
MIHKYFNGVLPEYGKLESVDHAYKDKSEAMINAVDVQMGELAFSKALQSIWEVISAGNKYIDETAPWILAKDPAMKERLGTVMYCLAESQRLVYSLLAAFMPSTAEKGLGYLGAGYPPAAESLSWGKLTGGTKIVKAEALFPRIEEKGE